MNKRIYLSPPDLAGDEASRVSAAIASGWIAPLGPEVDGFEREMCERLGVAHALALSSGTAGLHLALLVLGVRPGDAVWCSTLTFAATANAITYVGARPVFIDSDAHSWNLDPAIVAEELACAARAGQLPRALIAVDLYGQCADYDALTASCRSYGVAVIEDAAEALGATYKGAAAGSFGDLAVLSFNGNKIITTSGGGMLLGHDPELLARARHLSTQAREPARHYEHKEVGYNYRLSNLLAAVGRAQLADLDRRVEARRAIFERYLESLGTLPGWTFAPEVTTGRANRWLTCATLDPRQARGSRDAVLDRLASANIEARPVWKPMHLQPAFAHCEYKGGRVAQELFEHGLCLPSGSGMTAEEQERVIDVIRAG